MTRNNLPFRRPAEALVGLIAAALVSFSVLGRGIPELRHDWRIPLQQDAVAPWIASFYQPWTPSGLGAPQPYPTFFWLGFVLWPVHAIASSWSVIVLCVAGTILWAALSAATIARNQGAGTLAACGVSLLAALNPWVYSKYVAGHIFMVLAYAVVLALVAEATRPKPRSVCLVLLAAFAITQLEFFVIVCVPLAIWFIVRRIWHPLVAMLASALPIALGIAAYYGELRQTQYSLDWQRASSVPFLQGLLLRGYEFHYAAAFSAVWPALAVIVSLAVYGVVQAWRTPITKIAVSFGLAALVLASGTSGAVAAPYEWLVIHVPESGLFRELYDLVAIVAVAYVVLVSNAVGSLNRVFSVILMVATVALATPWLSTPVSSFFVPASDIPAQSFPARQDRRLALFPAYQPQSIQRMGSGYDPDLFVQTGKSLPINEFLPAFPVDAALGYAWYMNDFRYLGALGVSYIIARPYLRTDWASLGYQQATLRVPRRLPTARQIEAIPTLATAIGSPRESGEPQDLWSNIEFFADDPLHRQSAAPLRASEANQNAHQNWIDVRFFNLSYPQWMTAFGGVATSSSAPLQIPRGFHEILAATTNRIVDQQGQRIAARTKHLRWWPLRAGARSVTCFGSCAVALVGNPPANRLGADAWSEVEYRAVAPWLIYAHVPGARATQTLRFAETYSRFWIAIRSGTVLPHVRLNTAFNAWLLPPGNSSAVLLVQWVALLQFAAECLAAVLVIFLVVLARQHKPS